MAGKERLTPVDDLARGPLVEGMMIVEVEKPEGRRVAEGAERFDAAVLDDGPRAARREAALALPARHARAAQGEREPARHGMIPQGPGIPEREQDALSNRATGRGRDGLLVAEIVRQRTCRGADLLLCGRHRVIETSGLLTANARDKSQGVEMGMHHIGFGLHAFAHAIATDDRRSIAIHPMAGVQRLDEEARQAIAFGRGELVRPALKDVGERVPRQQNPRPLTRRSASGPRACSKTRNSRSSGSMRLHHGDLFFLEELAQRDREGAQPRVKRHVPEPGLDEGVERHEVAQRGIRRWRGRTPTMRGCGAGHRSACWGSKHVKGAVLRSGEMTAASAAGLPTAGLAQRGKWVPKPCAARHAAKPRSIARLSSPSERGHATDLGMLARVPERRTEIVDQRRRHRLRVRPRRADGGAQLRHRLRNRHRPLRGDRRDRH